MAFVPNKYPINRNYIKHGNARSGAKINKVEFLVAHDIGNGGSTADENQRYFNNHQPAASAHTFIDHTQILEIVPLDEKAWHVRYDVPADNQMFGDDANDCAIGTELCHGPRINFQHAYDRYVWYHAYLCHKFGLDPQTEIVPHAALDPGRRSDPHNAFNKNGKTYEQFINDVVKELQGSAWVALSTVSGLAVGGVATIKKSATHYQTGQEIASFVKGNKYKILQVKAVSGGNSHKAYLLGGILSWLWEQDIEESGVSNGLENPTPVSQPVPVPVPTPPKQAARKVFLPANNPTWTVYKLGRPCVKSNPVNIAGVLKPAKFGGLTYEILKDNGNSIYEIQTSNFGRVQIYAAPSTGARII